MRTQRQSARNFRFQLLDELEHYAVSDATASEKSTIEHLISYLDQTPNWQGPQQEKVLNFCMLCIDESDEHVLLEWSEKTNAYVLPWHSVEEETYSIKAVQNQLLEKYGMHPKNSQIGRLCNINNNLEITSVEEEPLETILHLNLVFAAQTDKALALHPLVSWKKISEIKAAPKDKVFHPNLLRMLAAY